MDILGQIERELDSEIEAHYNVRHLTHYLEGYRSYIVGRIDNPYCVGSARFYSFEAGWSRACKDLQERK